MKKNRIATRPARSRRGMPSGSTSSKAVPARSQSTRSAISSPAFRPGSNRILAAGRSGDALRVAGTEFIGTIKVPSVASDNAENKIIFSRLNVAAPTSTRLAQFASIYERWHARQYTYRVTSCCPTTAAGAYVIGQEPDPLADYADLATGTVNRLRTLRGSAMVQAWQSSECHLAPSTDYTSLWCHDGLPDAITEGDRLDAAGKLYCAIAAPFSSDRLGQALAVVELVYDIEFYQPRLSSSSLERQAEFTAPSGASTAFKGTAVSECGWVQEGIQKLIENTGSLASAAGLMAWLKTYVAYKTVPSASAVETKEPKKLQWLPVLSDPDVGWTAGLYKAKLVFASNSLHWDPPTFPYTVGDYSGYYTDFTYADDYSISGLPTNTVDWWSPEGELYRNAYTTEISFGVGGARAFLDNPLILSEDLPDFPGKWFFMLTAAGTSSYFELSSLGARRMKKVMHRPAPATLPSGPERKVRVSEPESEDDPPVLIPGASTLVGRTPTGPPPSRAGVAVSVPADSRSRIQARVGVAA